MCFMTHYYTEMTMSQLNKLWAMIPTFGMEYWPNWAKVVIATILIALWIKLLGIKGVLVLAVLWGISTLIMYFEDKVQK